MNVRMIKGLAVSCFIVTLAISCNRQNQVSIPVVVHHPQDIVQVESVSADTTCVLDLLEITGEPVMLSARKLTSPEAVSQAFNMRDTTEFLTESTPLEKSFFFPEKGVRNDELVRIVKERYNLATVVNKVVHAYEWFYRVSSYGEDVETPTTIQDTLRWVAMSQPVISPGFLASALPDDEARQSAANLLAAYSRFDGDDSPESPFSEVFDKTVEVFRGLPEFATEEMLNEFKEGFWSWYDKRQFVPEIDGIIKLSLSGYKGEQPDDEQIERLKEAVLCERDIDRRTILALELAKIGHIEAATILGDILESGIYTRYLLEAWISWRANTQMDHSPSSFSVIANNYYDMMRVKCMNTIVRHCQKEKDDNALCLLENLLDIELLHRMASLMGNESFLTLANLSNGEFIDPRLLNDKD